MSKRLTDRNREIPSLTAENQHFWLNVYHRLAKFEDAEEKEVGTGAVDVVEVVRCKDCRFYKPDIDGIYLCEHIKLPLFDPEPDFFCLYGKEMLDDER